MSKSAEFESLYAAADAAGMEAVAGARVVPMVVGSPTTPFGSDIDPNKPTYFVEDGACGFAWVNIKPGNCGFANWLKNQKLARPDSYYGGVSVWVSKFSQSVQKKEAYARAFANVIEDSGLVKSAYAQSRMD